jgi:hypothetical protein
MEEFKENIFFSLTPEELNCVSALYSPLISPHCGKFIKCNVKIKVKVKLSLCLTKHHTMKAYWGNGGIAPLIH